MSPPTSTLSYIFPAKTRGPSGEVLRTASLTQPMAPSRECSWGRGARPLAPTGNLGRGPPSAQSSVSKSARRSTSPRWEQGSCVRWEEGPSAPRGNARLRPGNSASPRGGSRLESHGVQGRVPRLPKCAGRGRDQHGRGAGGGVGGPVTEHFLFHAGAPGLLPVEDSGWGWGPRAAPPPPGQPLGLRRCAPLHPTPSPRPAPLRSHPLFSAQSRPGTTPGLTLSRLAWLQRAKHRD